MAEIGIGLIVCLFVLGIIGHIFGDDENAGGADELKLRVKDAIETNEENGYTYPALAIQVKGHIPVPHDACPVAFRLHIFDGLQVDLKPVLCTIEELQEQQTQVFEWRADPGRIPFHNGAPNWQTLIAIPREVLVFPAQGERRVTFQFCVVAPGDVPRFQLGFTDGTTGTTYALAQCTRSISNEDEGYEDGAENRRAAMNVTPELALHVAAVGVSVGEDETKVIKDWMTKVMATVPEEDQKEEKEYFRQTVNAAYKRVTAGDANVEEVVGRMNAIASLQEKYEALELCMDVMAADGKAEASEMKILDRIARMLQVDPKTYRSLRELRIAKLSDVGEVAGNLNTMLGLTADMSPEEVKRHLTAEYRKWNSRVSHSDDKIRARATEMLLVIGETRAKYVG